MERRKRKLIERVLALCLAFALILTGVLPHAVGTVVQAAETGDGSSSNGDESSGGNDTGGEEKIVATTIKVYKEDDRNSELTSDNVSITIKNGDAEILPIGEGETDAGKYNLIVGKGYTYILKTSIDGYVDTTSTFIAEEDGEVDVVLWMKDIEIATTDSKKEIQFSSPITTETKTITLNNKYKLEVVTGEDAGIVEIAGSKGNTETTYTISNKMSGTTKLAAYYYADENGEIGRKISDEISINVDNIQLEDITLSSPNKSSDSATINLGDATDCELKVVEVASEEIVDIVKSETENSWTISNQASGTTKLAVYCNDKKVSNDITVIVKSDIINPVFTITDPTNTGGNTSVTDVKVVKIEVSGLPAAATGNFDLYLDGTEEKVASVTKNSNKTIINFAYNSSTALTGNKTFTIKYSGDTNYESEEWKNIVGLNDLKLGQKIQFSDENNSVDTPQIAENGAFSFSLAESSTIGNVNGITYAIDTEKSDQSIVIDDRKLSSCNGSKQATVNVTAGTGLVAIKVNITGNDTYAAAPEQTYYAYVEKTYDLSDLEDMLTIQGEKTYDGSNKVTVTATMSSEMLKALHIVDYGDIDTSKELIFELEGTVDSEDVKYDANNAVTAYDTITITDIKKVEGYLNNSHTKVELTKTVTGENAIQGNADELLNHIPYVDTTFTDGVILGGEGKNVSVTIKPRTVYLYTDNITIPYATDVQEKLNALAGSNDNIVKEVQDADETTGIIATDSDIVKVNAFTVTVEDFMYGISTYTDVLNININSDKNQAVAKGENYKNYKFELKEDTKGDLTIEQQTFESVSEICRYFSFDIKESNASGTSYINSESVIWLGKDTTALKATIDDNTYYNAVIFVPTITTGEGDTTLTPTPYILNSESGYTIVSGMTEVSGKIYLAKVEDGETGTRTNISNDISSASVNVTFKIDQTAPTVKFDNLDSKVVEESSTSWFEKIFATYKKTSYEAGITLADEDGSGIANLEYHIYSVTFDEQTTEDAIQNYVNSLANSSGSWSSGKDDSGNLLTAIPLTKNKTEGNYIILVKVEDNVGNSAIYTSNGVICEDTKPAIQILGVETEATTVSSETEYKAFENKIYKNNIAYQLVVNDDVEDAIISGLDTITYTVLDGETVLADYPKTITIDDTSYDGSLENLKNFVQQSATGIITDCDSDNLKIQVTATDRAGNNSTFEQALKIDNTAPKMSVSGVENDGYYNAKKVMTVTYKERHFNPELATFTIKVNGEDKGVVTLKDLIENPIDGIKVTEYPQEIPTSGTTNQTTYIYQLTFGAENKDYDFVITPTVTDMAGNPLQDAVSSISFTVDMVVPVITVEYVDENGAPISGINTNTDEDSLYYTNKTVIAKVSIKERNFTKGGTITADSTMSNYAVEGETKNNSDVITSAANKDNWKPTDNETYVQEFTFKGDANYTFNISYTDLENHIVQLSENDYRFVVDKTAPTGKITVKELGTQKETIFDKILEVISFGFYRNDGFEITFESSDITSLYNQSYFMYATKDDMHGEQTQLTETGNTATEKTLTGITLESWIGKDKGYSSTQDSVKVTVEENTQQIPYMRLEDKAGNVSFISAEGVIDDRTNPEAPSITITLPNPTYGIYKEDVPFSIQVTDPTENGTYAGIKRISFRILNNGTETQSGTYEIADKTQRKQTVNWMYSKDTELLISSQKNNSNNVVIEVTAEDYAGLTVTETKSILIDVTSPKLSIEYDNTETDADYNAPRTATLTYTERNFNESLAKLKISVNKSTSTEVSLTELAAMDGITVTKISDKTDATENATDTNLADKTTWTDNRTVVYEITFGEDDADYDFEILPMIEDEAGNTNSLSTDNFTVDMVESVLKVEYYANKECTTEISKEDIIGDTLYYTNTPIYLKVTIEERNFKSVNGLEGQIAVTCDKENVYDTAVNTNYQSLAETSDNWTNTSNAPNTYTQVFTFAGDAKYSFNLTYTDLAGNTTTLLENPVTFVVDETAPTGVIKFDEKNWWDEFVSSITFGIFSKDSYTVSLEPKDATAGVNKAYYYLSKAALQESDLKKLELTDWKQFDDTNTFKVKPNTQFIAYAKIVDNAGNVKYISTDGAVSDDIKPEITVGTVTEQDEVTTKDNIYNSNAVFNISVNDPLSEGEGLNETYSGLEKVWYTVSTTGNVEVEETVVLLDNTKNKVQGNQTFTKAIEIDATKFNSNSVVVNVYARDFSGNEIKSEDINLQFDVTKPTVEMEFNDELSPEYGTTYGECYKSNRTALVTYVERNFHTDLAIFDICVNGKDSTVTLTQLVNGEVPGITASFESDTAEQTDARTIKYKLVFGADGKDYEFSVKPAITDKAGNNNEVSAETKEFTVDRVAPVIDVKYDNNEPSNGVYFASQRTMTIMYTERHFDEALALFDITVNGVVNSNVTLKSLLNDEVVLDGIDVSRVTASEETDENKHSYVIIFGSSKNEYDFRIIPSVKDKAGNSNTGNDVNVNYAEGTVCEDTFTVDMKNPEVSVLYFENGEDITDKINSNKWYYTNNTVYARVTIKEHNFAGSQFADGQISLTCDRTNADESASNDTTDYQSFANTRTDWSEVEGEADTYTQEFAFSGNAMYGFNFTYKDLAQNEDSLLSDSKIDKFVVDKVKPTGSVAIDETESWKDLIEKITFGIFKNTNYTVSLDPQDITAGMETAYYYLDASGETLTKDDLSGLSEDKWTEFNETNTFEVKPNQQFVAYVKLVDKSGNIDYISTDGAVADNTAPVVAVENLSTPSEDGFYNGEVNFKVTATDESKGETYSGIKKIWYNVSATGNVTKQDTEIIIEDNNKGENNVQGTQKLTGIFKISASDYNSNNVIVEVYAEDFSGNVSQPYVIPLKMDATAPIVEMVYDSTDVANDTYYHAVRTATVTYKERNFKPNLATFEIQVNGGETKTFTLTELMDGAVDGIKVTSQGITGEEDKQETAYKFEFGQKGYDYDFTVKPAVTDMANNSNESEAAKESFTVDMVSPVVNVQYYENEACTKEITDINSTDWYYAKAPIYAKVTIKERNFSPVGEFVEGQIQVLCEKENVKENTAVTDYQKLANNRSKWVEVEGAEDTYTQTFAFEGDAKYKLNFTYTDLAQNAKSFLEKEAMYQFAVDMTAPTGTIRIDDTETWQDLLEIISFGIFKNKAYTVSLETDDITSDVETAYYYKDASGDALTKDDLDAVTDWTEFDETNAFAVEPNEQFVAYAKIVDKSGNVTYISTDGAVADNQAPTIEVSYEEYDEENSDSNILYNTNAVFEIDVEDPEVGDTYSGLEKVWYTVVADGNVEESVEIVLKDNSSNKIQGNQLFTTHFEISAKKFNSNDVRVCIGATDFSGNTYITEEYLLEFDTTAPTVQMEYDSELVPTYTQYGQYYKEVRTATVTYVERNFSEELALFTVSINGTESVVSLADIIAGKVTGINAECIYDVIGETDTKDISYAERTDDRELQYQLTFGADGSDYDFVVTPSILDMAGNENKTDAPTETFTVDMVAPEITVTYDNNAPYNDTYFNSERTMTITYTERNFAEELATFDISVSDGITTENFNPTLASLLAEDETKVEIEGIVVERTEEKQTYTITFGTDGFDYDFTIIPYVIDKSANDNMDATSNTAIVNYAKGTVCKTAFTVDMVIPEIQVQYLEVQNAEDENVTDITESINTDNNEQNWYYTNNTIKAVVTITERNFASTEKVFSEELAQINAVYGMDFVNADNTEMTSEDYIALAENRSNWVTDKQVYTQTFEFAGEADYTFNLTYTDLAGNTISLLGEEETYKFVVDKTAPTGAITVKELGKNENPIVSIFREILEKVSFGLYHNEGFEIIFESEDITSIYNQSYFMYATSTDMHGEEEQLVITGSTPQTTTLSGIDRSAWIESIQGYGRNSTVKTQTVTTNKNTQQIPYMRLEDKAGNVSFISSEGVIDDRQAPNGPEITIDVAEPTYAIYKDDVPFTITVTDPTTNGTYAGLESITFEIINNVKTVEDGLVKTTPTTTQSGDYVDFNAQLTDKTARVQSVTWSSSEDERLIIDSEKNNSNYVTIKVTATDYAGNVSVKTKDVMIDITKPELEIVYDNSTPVNEKYYNHTKKAKITYTERNFAENLATFAISVNGEKQTVSLADLMAGKVDGIVVSSYPTELIGFPMDESTYEYELIFGTDGFEYDFEITPSVTDMALNGNEIKAETAIFTVDMVTPEIEIQYVDENNVPITSINTDTDEQNWYYTNKTVKAIVTITERNFALPEETFSEEPKQVEVEYKKTYVKPQTALTDYVTDAETLTKWNLSKDDIYSQTFVFAGEANYEFNLTYTDLAGNTISLLEDETYKFVVDKTAPTGTIKVKELGTQGTTSIFDKLLSMISFGLYHNEGFEITFESDDITSIYKQSYFMYATEDDMHGEQAQLTVTGAASTEKTLTGIALQSWIGEDAYARNPKMQTFKTVENTQQIPYMRLEDKAGNVAFISAEGVIDDRSNPEAPQITIDLEAPDHGIYEEKDGVPFTITVTDPTVNGTYAGLKSISYEILKDGVVTQSGNYDAELANKTGRTQTITHQEVIDTTKNNSNDVKIVVNALDYAGNTSTMTKEVMIDITEPTIHVEFNNDADVENGKYFNTDRVMTITITERNMETGSTADGMTFDVKAGVGIGTQDYDTDITLSELKAHYGIDYKWVSDSEAGTDVLKLSDARKSVLVLTFDKDNEYYIVPHCKDLGDNTESSLTYANDTAYAKEFVIDKTAPVIEVSYSLENVTSNNDQRAYSNQTVTAKVSITEQNFWLEGTAFSKEPLQWNFDKTLGTEMAETINDYQAEANDVKQWSRNVIVSQKIFEFAKDANYTFGFTYTDLAGNVAVYEPHYFTVDKTLPEGTITLDGKSVWNNFWQMISFNIFKDDTYEMVMTSTDATAGVASTSYYKAEQPLTEAQVKELASDAWVVLNPSDMRFTISPDEQFVVYGRIIDRSGNVRFIYPTNGAVADVTKPTITVTNLTPARNEIHNTDVTFHVEVKDPTSGNTYSGLEKVWYTIHATGNVSEQDEVVLVDNSANKVQSNQEWSGEFTVSSQRFNSNNIEIQVHATDFTGNTYSTEIIPLQIDITEPTINITYDLNAPSNEKYYKDVRTAVITVTERNFDPDGVRINITNTDGVQPIVGSWSKGTGTGIVDSAINTCTVTFEADGDYTFAFDCTDLSGNVSQVVQTEEFTVDRTVPTIEVGYDNNNAMNDFYYATPRTATVTVTEHNFNGSEVQAAINATLEAQGISAPGVNGWHTSGDTHSATILFDRDGNYGFTLNYGDLAGNPATEFVATEFTIDQTKPVIEITDIEDRSANNGEVRPAISYSDVNYDEQNVTITIKGVKHTEASVDGTRSMIHNGQNIKLDDFAYEEAADDVYTLTASVVDRAGNSEEQSVLFSVNRFGSTYMFSESTADFLDKYYANEEQDLVITEINVDRLERRDVSYGRDGELVNLEEGVHYSVEESGNDVSWKSFEYTISAENFEQEGLYNVTIDSKDQATNEVNNKIKNADINFVIDKTSPSVVVTGIENEQYTENTRDITLNIVDNVAMANVDVHVNDKVVNFDSDVIQEQQGVLSYTLESSDEWQEVYAVATDTAGNSATSEEYRVLISANLLVQIWNNPILLGAIGTVAVGGIGGFYFLFKRRKKIIK